MSKINSRSPYYINHTVSSSAITNVRINLWIYTGTQTTSRPTVATYVLESTPINGSVQVDIANLVKDYFVPSHTSSEILWVDYRIDELEPSNLNLYKLKAARFTDTIGSCNEDGTFDSVVDLYFKNSSATLVGVSLNSDGDIEVGDGYSGTDVTYSSQIIFGEDRYIVYGSNESISVGGDDNRAYSAMTCTSGDIIDETNNTQYTAEEQLIATGVGDLLVTSLSIVQLEGFYGYGYFEDSANPQINKPILLSSNYILQNSSEEYRFPFNNNYGSFSANVYDADETLLFIISDSATNNSSSVIDYYTESFGTPNNIQVGGETYYIETVTECKYNPYKVTFINKYGALEDVWFFKNNKIDLNVETESFRRNIVSGGSYSLQDHQYHTLKKQGRETITLNSGFYPEGANETFRQLLFSDYAWITHEGNVLPIQIKDSSFNFKTRLTDRVINYTMQFEFAFDKINTVR